jgi:chemotaxis protein MotB
MARSARSRRSRGYSADYWPGFVDALATLLLVLIFLLSIFVLAQFFLGQALSGRDAALERLNVRIAELADLLDLEKDRSSGFEIQITQLTATLASSDDASEAASSEVIRLQGLLAATAGDIRGLEGSVDDEKAISAEARALVELLNQQMAALRQQIASLSATLDASEERDARSQAEIANLGTRLNAALAQKVQELARYRSEFFGRLRKALGDRDDIEVVGDRFILQSEVLFGSGSADISAAGRAELKKVAGALKEITATIPGDINWVLRVDGHSDAVPINTPQFPSNWHLSSARAISVVTFLVDEGVAPGHLVAAGFGEFQPLDNGTSRSALRRNRRIEFKLTER